MNKGMSSYCKYLGEIDWDYWGFTKTQKQVLMILAKDDVYMANKVARLFIEEARKVARLQYGLERVTGTKCDIKINIWDLVD